MEQNIKQTEAILNMCSFNPTFPNLPKIVISRDSYLELFEEQLEENKVLCVNGSVSGIGVTTTLAMFARKHSYDCVSFFYDGFSRYLLNSKVVEGSLSSQLMFYANGKVESDTDNYIQSSIYKIRKKSNSKRTFLYFVFDGFNNIPPENIDTIKQLLALLFNIENSRFIFSGTTESIQSFLPEGISTLQTNAILRFQRIEVSSYLISRYPKLDKNQVNIFYDLSKGNAELLSVLISKYEYSGDIKTLESIYINNVTDFYEEDIEYLNNSQDKNVILLLALLTFAEIPLNEICILHILKVDKDNFNSLVEYCKDYVAVRDNHYEIKSLQFHKYLSKQLQYRKNDVEILQISAIENSSDMDLTFNSLPALYKDLKNKTALVSYLTSEKVQRYLIDKKSQAALNEQCEYGYYACTDFTKQIADYFRFAITRSSSREIEKNELSDSEIEALIAVGNEEEAYSLTQNVFLLEERLKCLLIIARRGNKLTEYIHNEIMSQITSLVDIIDFKHIPNKAIELAKLMLPVDFVRALTIIDKIAKVTKDKNQLDKIYTAISLSYNMEGTSSSDNSAKADIVNTRIADNGLKKMANAMKSIFADSNVSQVLNEIEKLSTPSSKLYFLQFWIPDHKDLDHIEDAVIYAIKLIIETANISVPKVSLLVHYCVPLKDMSEDKVKEVTTMLDAVVDNIKYPTIDYVSLQLSIIAAISKFDKLDAKDRLENLYLEIRDFQDKTIEIHSKSLILKHFEDLGEEADVEKWLTSKSELQKEITDDIDRQLKMTAYHMKVVDGPIRALVCKDTTFIFDAISKINTEARKSKAYLLALTEYIRQTDIEKIDWKYFDKLYSNVSYDKSELSEPLIILVVNLVNSKEDKSKLLQLTKRNFDKLDSIEDATDKCYVYSKLYVWVKNNFPSNNYAEDVIRPALDKSWESIDIQWVKVEVGYQIAKQLSRISMKVEAKDYTIRTSELRKAQLLCSYSCISAYHESLDLYIHSLGILIRMGKCKEQDIEQFKTFLEYHNSEGESIIYWSRIALEYYLANDIDKFSSIVNVHVSKSIDGFSKFYQKRVFYQISPTLFFSGPDLFFDRLKSFDEYFANFCLENVARFIVTKYPYSENSDSVEITSKQVLVYKDYEYLLNLMEHSEDESFIFDYTDDIANRIKTNASNKLSREQRDFIFDKLEKLVDKKFPLTNGIKHDGYKIACKASIKGCKGSDVNYWDKIIEDIEKIDNRADQAFLYSHVSHYAKKVEQRNKLLDLAISKAETISSNFDKMNRLDMCLSEAFETSSKPRARTIAEKAIKSVMADHNGSYQDCQKIIDIVHDHDKSLANDILDLIDDDVARIQYKNKLKKHVASNKKIDSARQDIKQVTTLSKEEQIRFFKKQLEFLIKKKAITRDIDSMASVVKSIYDNPITDTKNTILFFIENLYEKNCQNHLYNDLIRNIHQSLYYNIKLVLAVAAGTKERLERINRIIVNANGQSSGSIIRVGQIEQGFKLLESWFNKHLFDNLRIIDPFFSPLDLPILKKFFDIKNDLRVTILTHKSDKITNLDSYQIGWNSISADMTGTMEIIAFCFKDDPSKCPVHDRWWILYNSETGKSSGRRLNSISGLGKRDSEISIMENESIESVNILWTDYVFNRRPKMEDRKIEYEEIRIK